MKLTAKLIFAFLLVSLVSAGIIVLFTSIATNREFENFISQRYKAEFAEDLGRYYQERQTWDDVEGVGFCNITPITHHFCGWFKYKSDAQQTANVHNQAVAAGRWS